MESCTLQALLTLVPMRQRRRWGSGQRFGRRLPRPRRQSPALLGPNDWAKLGEVASPPTHLQRHSYLPLPASILAFGLLNREFMFGLIFVLYHLVS